jgi:Leucine-rich repeat (LRR) protein
LRSLTILDLRSCNAVRNLPDIGHMRDLTHLSIRWSAVEEIKGVEKLSSLEELDCSGSGLKTLPDLRHLPHLWHVELRSCPVVKDPSSPYYERDDVQFDRENKHVDVSDTSDNE